MKTLGEFEILVLAALVRLDDEQAYGVAILREIESRSGRAASMGSLYPTLARLEKKSYVHSRMGEAKPVRGGRAKRYYGLTATGAQALEESLRVLSAMASGLPGWQAGEGSTP